MTRLEQKPFLNELYGMFQYCVQCSQICSPFDKNHFPSERRKRVEAKKFDKIKIKDIESKHKIS